MTSRTVDVWQYLADCAPLGDEIRLDRHAASAALGMSREHVSSTMTRLLDAGVIKRAGKGVYVVAKAVDEELLIKRRAKPGPKPNRQSQSPLVYVPEDTRSLTGSLMGDPPPGRSALDQRGTHG